MNFYLIAGAVLALIVAAVHSILGEVLIFHRLRLNGVIPNHAPHPLQEKHVRILWATWHIASIMGCGFALILFCLAQPIFTTGTIVVPALAVSGTMLTSSMLVLIATKGRHPGWIGLLGVTVLSALGALV